ncbi:MAG TPA: metal-dependent transcriptional regulator [Armatimonadota bacterium]|jgi:DtxR family Mn-dependent transcriptional regulator|nr:metal-dependent transcriptional regulator [Armatimonadota bacterium]
MSAESLQLTASMEDYLEAIYRLARDKRVVRVRDVAKSVGVTPPSATGAIKALKARGLVSHEKYEDVLLTDIGEAVAADVNSRHEELRSFFEDVLLLDPDLSESEACALEHSISGQTLERLRRFLSCIRHCGGSQPGCIRDFRELVDAGDGPEGLEED